MRAIIDKDGVVRLLETVRLAQSQPALVTILENGESTLNETALLSERSLAKDWNRPEEDAAWAHLQSEPSS
ncbi:MAG: hypothetical protein L0Y44_13815 [Phycisphaerales bacterium]|nr:hypothetical protein [Phycisphaerales bacterium]MCI0674797.1 hypothetical protein [Phycisphaerales bacterium]